MHREFYFNIYFINTIQLHGVVYYWVLVVTSASDSSYISHVDFLQEATENRGKLAAFSYGLHMYCRAGQESDSDTK